MESIWTSLDRDGVVVLHGLGGDRAAFNALATRLLDDLERQIYRSGTADFTQSVNAGEFPVVFHAEYGAFPFRPDLLCLHCAQPALSDGETTACDGIDVFDALSSHVQDLFRQKRLRYRMRIPIKMADALRSLPAVDDLVVGDDVLDGTVCYEWVSSALRAVPSRNGALAFSNSLVPLQSMRAVTFEDGTEINSEIMTAVESALDATTRLIKLQSGDAMILDNHRMMHGRRGFRGTRVLHQAFGRSRRWRDAD